MFELDLAGTTKSTSTSGVVFFILCTALMAKCLADILDNVLFLSVFLPLI